MKELGCGRLAGAIRGLPFVTIVLVLAPWVAAQGAGGNPDTPELKEVMVDLASGTIRAVLPFDEPFILTGTPPAQTTRIEATFCEIEDASAERLGNLLQGEGSRSPLSLCRDQALKLTPWLAQTTNFQLFVPQRLRPNRSYLFNFTVARALGENELTILRTQVRANLDRAFLDLTRAAPPSLTAVQYNQLLDVVRGVLAGFPLQSGLSLQAEQGSVWAASTRASDDFASEPPWQEQLRRVWEAQQQRAPIAQRLDNQAVPALFVALSGLRANAALVPKQARYEWSIASSPSAVPGLYQVLCPEAFSTPASDSPKPFDDTSCYQSAV